MLPLIAELVAYQAWADAKIVAAVKAHPPAVEDERIRVLLHHIVAVQRYFLQKPIEDGPVPLFSAIESLFVETAQYAAWLEGLNPDHVLQAVLHSQHHRGQVSTRLRALGGAPPTVDYIIWKKGRP
jgi:uncharacterized damage-inducible protein DinB